jgi:16S rRNA A1518/A1519 N6-dimethyltransferase RsmA/KsgA/DIM1 with predicted DNA glycosylase/AP lyase activity
VEMIPRPDAASGEALTILSNLVRGLFLSRRKTIRNNLARCAMPDGLSREMALDAMAGVGIDPGARAEEVSPDSFLAVARVLTGSGAP